MTGGSLARNRLNFIFVLQLSSYFVLLGHGMVHRVSVCISLQNHVVLTNTLEVLKQGASHKAWCTSTVAWAPTGAELFAISRPSLVLLETSSFEADGP